MTGFGEAISVTAATGHNANQGWYDLDIHPDMSIGGKPNGGYLLAAIANAAATDLRAAGIDHPHPIASTAHYLRAPNVGPAQVEVTVLRSGRSATHTRATLHQAGEPHVEAVFTFARLDSGTTPWWSDGETLTLAEPEHCIELPAEPPGMGVVVAIQRIIETRMDPSRIGFAVGQPSMNGELRGWLSFRDGREPDPFALIFAADAFPPATFDLGAIGGWVPTFQFSVYVRALPAPGRLKVRQRTRVVAGHHLDEVCEIWDSQDRLVAQATQLAGFRPPRAR